MFLFLCQMLFAWMYSITRLLSLSLSWHNQRYKLVKAGGKWVTLIPSLPLLLGSNDNSVVVLLLMVQDRLSWLLFLVAYQSVRRSVGGRRFLFDPHANWTGLVTASYRWHYLILYGFLINSYCINIYSINCYCFKFLLLMLEKPTIYLYNRLIINVTIGYTPIVYAQCRCCPSKVLLESSRTLCYPGIGRSTTRGFSSQYLFLRPWDTCDHHILLLFYLSSPFSFRELWRLYSLLYFCYKW